MLVKCDQLAQSLRCQPIGENRVRRPVAFEDAMWRQPIRCTLGLDLLQRFSEGERLSLREDVCEENVVMPSDRVERLSKRDEVAGDQSGALMDQLIEGMLAIGA